MVGKNKKDTNNLYNVKIISNSNISVHNKVLLKYRHANLFMLIFCDCFCIATIEMRMADKT